MGVRKDGMNDGQAAEAGADGIEALFKSLGLSTRLSDLGVPEDGIDQIAEDAMTDFVLHRNVRKIQSLDDLKGILATVK